MLLYVLHMSRYLLALASLLHGYPMSVHMTQPPHRPTDRDGGVGGGGGGVAG